MIKRVQDFFLNDRTWYNDRNQGLDCLTSLRVAEDEEKSLENHDGVDVETK